ncbi:MAG: HEPN domain-containing protein [Candidatus Micrarchaeota archaeon]
MDVKECIGKGLLQRVPPNRELSAKEWREAELDMAEAKALLKEKRLKRSTTTSYYAMFHAAKAVLFKLGFREKAHYAIAVVLEDLAKRGKLEMRFADDFRAAMHAREGADYHYSYSEETARSLVSIAGEFVTEMKKLYRE